MDMHLQRVVQASLAFSKASEGAFDITIAPAMTAWGFGPIGVLKIPAPHQIDSIQKRIDYRLLLIRNDSLLKRSPLVQIDVNGIAQGYTVDLIAERLSAAGIAHYLIELGGEIRLKGQNPQGRPWSIGVEWPTATPISPTPYGWTFMPDRPGVTTSGVYRNRRTIEGSSYTHVIDPRTAKPVDNDILSVTVIAPDAMTADAVDHTCLILGRRRSLRWVSSLQDVDIFIVYKDIRGRIRTQSSRGFPKASMADGGVQRRIGNGKSPMGPPVP
jgi:thiamine biosynthesis lipoprotein